MAYRRGLGLLWLGLIAVCGAGCTNAVRHPILLADHSTRTTTWPLSTYIANANVANFFFVHGISHSEPDWADGFMKDLAMASGATVPRKQLQPVTYPIDLPGTTPSPSTPPAGYLRYLEAPAGRDAQGRARVLRFHAVQWSALTDPWKCTPEMVRDRDAGHPLQRTVAVPDGHGHTTSSPQDICTITNAHFPVRRALLNGPVIKETLLDDGFPDVVLYLAPNYGPKIRAVIDEAFCRMVLGDPQIPCSAERLAKRTPLAVGQSETRFVFVTHSLGSTALLETWDELVSAAKKRDAGTCEEDYKRNPFIAHWQASPDGQKLIQLLAKATDESTDAPTPFYMLANQWSLLELHTACQFIPMPTVSRSSTASKPIRPIQEAPFFLHRFSPTRRDLSAGSHIDILAFNDPNDDLSFLLPTAPTEASDATGRERPRLDVFNILVSNATEILGLFELPNRAHLGYFLPGMSPMVRQSILCGIVDGRPQRCAAADLR